MVNTLTWLFSRAVGDLAVVAVQNPVLVGERSVPQPDLALLGPRADRYSRSHPTSADVLLGVEVAEATLQFDLGTKIPLYARCGIAEAWVIDVPSGERLATGRKRASSVASSGTAGPLISTSYGALADIMRT